MSDRAIVKAAVEARTMRDAEKVQTLIQRSIGGRYQRPLGDTWNNQGLLTASGSSYDHKLLEAVTNMQDSNLELLALLKFGNQSKVPYLTPFSAAEDLMSGMNRKERASFSGVTLYPARGKNNKRFITAVMEDRGCGLTPEQIPATIFRLGASHKNGVDWQQGTFGLGGTTIYRNAGAVVLVTRRNPALLEAGQEDRISVAVVEWEQVRTTVNAFYLVTSEWKDRGDQAQPFSIPAKNYRKLEPGTHLAIIDYATEGLARLSSDERSFAAVFDTRLIRPVMPIEYQNTLVRNRVETLGGLESRLDRKPAAPGSDERDTLPFSIEGKTYHLTIRFRLFSKRGTKGERRKFVAHGHALVVTSNGQVHSHWTPQDFKRLTKLNKLYDRVLVVVDSDALPVELRTQMFTADRAQLVKSPDAMRLEGEISAFLNDWPALRDANSQLIKEAITGGKNDRPTLEIAKKISRAISVKGFSAVGSGSTGGGSKIPKPTPEEDLYGDPTHFEGPVSLRAKVGVTRGIHFKLNAEDDFLDSRGQLHVTCDHPDIGPPEITVGALRSGRVRVSLSVPQTLELGTFKLTATIPPWTKKSGGLGPQFEWESELEIVDATLPTPSGKNDSKGKNAGNKGTGSDGSLVGLIWKETEEQEGWTRSTVGSVEMVSGKDLAAKYPEYKELSRVSDEIPTIVLNSTYSPLKKYIQARAETLTDDGKEQARERYAIGAGVVLLGFDQQRRKAEKGTDNTTVDEDTWSKAQDVAARGVLSVLPEFDRLAKEYED